MRNGQAYQQKTEKFFVYEEKKFGRIDSRNQLDFGYSETRIFRIPVKPELGYLRDPCFKHTK